jgi:hypothetical protein
MMYTLSLCKSNLNFGTIVCSSHVKMDYVKLTNTPQNNNEILISPDTRYILNICMYVYIHTHKHTHTYTYMWSGRERER